MVERVMRWRAVQRAGRAVVGFFLGLAPLALAAIGVVAFFVPIPLGGWLSWLSWLSWFVGAGVLLAEALAALPLLLYPPTRAFGAGMAWRWGSPAPAPSCSRSSNR
jgi:hypothetical protein